MYDLDIGYQEFIKSNRLCQPIQVVSEIRPPNSKKNPILSLEEKLEKLMEDEKVDLPEKEKETILKIFRQYKKQM